jgi:hypothetical protein
MMRDEIKKKIQLTKDPKQKEIKKIKTKYDINII